MADTHHTGPPLTHEPSGGPDERALLLADDPDKDPLLQILKKDNFSSKRFRCISRPELAAETLGPWAALELEIVGAKDLVASSVGMFEVTSNAIVRVFMDDHKHFFTPAIRSLNPEWNYKCTLHITTPRSMVRLQVAESGSKDETGTGFVEFSLGDLPFDKEVQGYLELRFQDNLQQTSTKRYGEHSKARDEEKAALHKSDEEQETLTSTQTPVSETSADAHSISSRGSKIMSLISKEAVTRYHKARATTKCGCYGANKSDSRSDEAHNNAGEIYVRMTLKRLGSKLDYWCSLALHDPKPKNFGQVLQEGKYEPLNVQRLYDDVQEFKYMVYEDAAVYVYNYISYICMWRSVILSALLTTIFVATCIQTWLFPVTMPGTIAIALFLNAFPRVRRAMTTSGLNAPMTQKGFEDVAKKRVKYDLRRYVQRLVSSFEGIVLDDAKLKLVCVRCCRDGAPMITFDELKHQLMQATWIKIDHKEITEGTLVLVDERFRGTIKKVHGHGDHKEADIEYDGGGGPSPVSFSRLSKRDITGGGFQAMMFRQTSLLPATVDTQIRTIHDTMVLVASALGPFLTRVADIVTWKAYGTAFMICAICASCSALGVFLFIKEVTSPKGVNQSNPILAAIVSEIDNAAAIVIVLLIMVPAARWWISLRAIFRAIRRACCLMPRKAPKGWAFYRSGHWSRMSA